jgi:AraC-like DNA-binding protein
VPNRSCRPVRGAAKDDLSWLQTNEILCDIVDALNRLDPSRLKAFSADKSGAIEAAAAIYRREFSKPPTTEQLALRVGVNQNVPTGGFEEMYGLTPHAYCFHVRMDEAKRLLENKRATLSEIGRQIGYTAIQALYEPIVTTSAILR